MSYMFTFYDMHILLYVQLDYSTRLSKSIPKYGLRLIILHQYNYCDLYIFVVLNSMGELLELSFPFRFPINVVHASEAWYI